MSRTRSKVWRDSAHVRLLRVHAKPDAEDLFPLRPGDQLKPRFVLLETVHFAAGKPQFSAEMHDRLHFAARFVNAFPDYPLVLEGHADNTGDPKKNFALSQQRAEQIKVYLNEIHYISLAQMHVKSFGDTDPIASNATEEGRSQNRRVDIVLMDAVPK